MDQMTVTTTMTHNKGQIKKSNTAAFKVFAVLLAIGVAAILASLFYGISLCIVYNLIGVPCFSCGMTRAFMSLPNIGRAFAYHPLFFTVPGIPLLMLLPVKTRNTSAIVLIVLFIAVWIMRMVLFYPHTSPMVFNENALFAHLIGH